MGHIHIGYDNPEMSTNIEIVKAMDLFLGVPSILLDTDTERRKLYGKAGAFRPKSYGVEYRTLSGFWIANDELIAWAFNNALEALKHVNNGNIISEDKAVMIQDCINTGNEDIANRLIDEFNININRELCVV